MTIKLGQTVRINGERHTVASISSTGIIVTTRGKTFDLWFDLVESDV